MSAWDDEYTPPALRTLADSVRQYFGLPWAAIGLKGDESHTYGYHRSRRWIMEDGQGSDDYSVQLAKDQGGDANWICALDTSLDPDRMHTTTARLMDALKAKDPRVASVREVFGTLDSRNVTGWDASDDSYTTADDSHLWHVHISLYRSMANNDHSGILSVIKGDTVADDYGKYGKPPPVGDRTIAVMISDIWNQELRGVSPYDGKTPSLHSSQLARIDTGVKDIQAAIAKLAISPVDVAALAAALKPMITEVVSSELKKLTMKAVQ